MRSLGVAIPGLALALAGPAAVGFVSRYATKFAPAFLVHLLSVTCIILIVLGVFALARSREGLSPHRLGFARVAWSSLTIGLVLALFFILVFGPLAYWAVAQLNMGTFDEGLSNLAKLPVWYLVLTIVIVATAEELLYRAYAIESLSAITGSDAIAGALSLSAFAAAHVPLWGGTCCDDARLRRGRNMRLCLASRYRRTDHCTCSHRSLWHRHIATRRTGYVRQSRASDQIPGNAGRIASESPEGRRANRLSGFHFSGIHVFAATFGQR